jgi:hypothetical protein
MDASSELLDDRRRMARSPARSHRFHRAALARPVGRIMDTRALSDNVYFLADLSDKLMNSNNRE